MFIFLGGHSWVDDLYTATKIIAVVAAAIFFFYKALTGYLVTNMSIELSLSRRRADDNYDYLAVVVTLTKGDRGTVRIQDAKARITEGATPLPPIPLVGVNRLTHVQQELPKDWSMASSKNPFLNLSPGEKAQFVTYGRISRAEVCVVEVAILGKLLWNFSRFGQWRASAVSLPLKSEDSGLIRLMSLVARASHQLDAEGR
jgi:hypothetical protein